MPREESGQLFSLSSFRLADTPLPLHGERWRCGMLRDPGGCLMPAWGRREATALIQDTPQPAFDFWRPDLHPLVESHVGVVPEGSPTLFVS